MNPFSHTAIQRQNLENEITLIKLQKHRYKNNACNRPYVPNEKRCGVAY
jgi:hypothetical protein